MALTSATRPASPWEPVDRLRGIGPKLRAALEQHGIRRVVDLVLHLPSRYEDRCQRVTLDDRLDPGKTILTSGRVTVTSVRHGRRRRLRIVSGLVSDGRGTLPVVWFNQPWIDQHLSDDREVSLFGPLREGRGGRLELVNPEVNEMDDDAGERIVPVYPRLGPLGGRRLRRLMEQALSVLDQCQDPISEALRRELDLPELAAALRALHAPEPPADEPARQQLVAALAERRTDSHRRLAFDELLAFACGLADHRARRSVLSAPACAGARPIDELARDMFPFDLTAAQRRVAGEIGADLARQRPMARLVQGDVGCGKTAVAALAIRRVVESGCQAALMAPTELLAEQHARTLSEWLAPSGQPVRLLTSSLPPPERKVVLDGLARGDDRVVVGTHALIQDRVEFARLGLVVVDEQHRFGAMQRQRLVDKGDEPHLLVMTATPIPRSLALTLYGDLELSLIDELPPGRHSVATVVRRRTAKDRIFSFLRREISAGGRVYVVYPVIEGGETSDLPALENHAAEVAAGLPGVEIGIVHGRMARAEREDVIGRFRSGVVEVLLTTTVVEVGIDVPEATVVLIEGAERFGLSQLHQLRGRVGRGDRRSWCILLSDGREGAAAKQRLEVLCRTDDGFEIAEADLALRGPGELTGYRQWGPAGFRFAHLVRDVDLIAQARQVARRLAAEGILAGVREELSRYHRVGDVVPAG